jgi:uncharacterized membrane protein required for colicin V production
VTWIDVLAIVLVLAYAALGYFTGVVRRGIALISLYVACIAATGMGVQAGNLIQQGFGVETPDGRIWGFFGVLAVVIIAIDGAAQLAHRQIQIEAIVWNRVSGVIVGVFTALLLSVILVYELQAAGSPSGGGAISGTQASVHEAVKGSKLAVPIMNAIYRPIIAVFQPVLPGDPHQYFSRGPVT